MSFVAVIACCQVTRITADYRQITNFLADLHYFVVNNNHNNYDDDDDDDDDDDRAGSNGGLWVSWSVM
jgi:hypothetical protein